MVHEWARSLCRVCTSAAIGPRRDVPMSVLEAHGRFYSPETGTVLRLRRSAIHGGVSAGLVRARNPLAQPLFDA